MTKKLILILLIGFFQLTNFEAKSQPGFDDDVEDTPIDGGVGLLIATGLIYGAKKVRKNLKV
jgi:hypothetical protein